MNKDIWRIIGFKGISSNPKCLIHGNAGVTEAASAKNVVFTREGKISRRPGLKLAAVFQTRSGETFKGGRDGRRVYLNPVGGAFVFRPVKAGSPGTYYLASGNAGGWKTVDRGGSWERVYGNPVSLFSFVDDDTGYLSYATAIKKTTDGGITWSDCRVLSFTPSYLAFPSAQTGYAGNGSSLAKTADGGRNWSSLTLPAIASLSIYQAYFPDEQNGWLAGSEAGQGSIALHTADGGENWEIQYQEAACDFASCFMADETTGYAGGNYGAVLKTADGGASWRRIRITGAGETSSHIVKALYFLEPQTGFAAVNYSNSAKLYKTADGGESWSEITLSQAPYPWAAINRIYFADQNTGYLAGSQTTGCAVRKTGDGGQTWSSLNPGVTPSAWSGMSFLDENIGWICGGPAIVYTADGGTTWTIQNNPSGGANKLDIHAADAENVWACDSAGYTWKTTDGGLNWMRWSAGGVYALNSIRMLDAGNGWACGENCWVKISEGNCIYNALSGSGKQIHPVNADLILLARSSGTGNQGKLYRSTDGSNFTEIYACNADNAFYAVAGDGADRLWAAGFGGRIYYSPDRGENWNRQTSPVSGDLRAIAVIDRNIAVMGGNAGVILRTADGGATWGSRNSPTGEALTAIAFSDAEHGLMGGYNSALASSSNAGVNWESRVIDPPDVWCIGGLDGNVYEVPEGSSPQADKRMDQYAPGRIRFMDMGDYVYGLSGCKSSFTVNSFGNYGESEMPACWKFGFERLGYPCCAVSNTTTDYRRRLYLSGAEFVNLGSLASAPIVSIGKTPNEGVIALKEDGSLWQLTGSGDYFLRRVAENLGTPVPYLTFSTERGVLFCTLDHAYLWNGSSLVSLTPMFDSPQRLLAGFDPERIWEAGGGLNPVKNQYWITYPQTSGAWRTLVYDLNYGSWAEFVNPLFTEGSFYNQGRNFYLSLDDFDENPPGLYLLEGDGQDPRGEIPCEYESGAVYDPVSPEVQKSLRRVYVIGKGWDTAALSRQRLDGSWETCSELPLENGVVNPLNPEGGILGRAFKIKLKAALSAGEELTLEEIILEFNNVRRG